MTQTLAGTGVALVTPFDDQLQVDFRGLARLMIHIMDSRVDYLVVHGTTGEAATTTIEEKRGIMALIREHNARKLPIILGVSGNDTRTILRTVTTADLREVTAVMVTSPHYSRPSQEGIYKHYKLIADTCPIPLLLYNVPTRTSSNIHASTTLKLSEHPNVFGIKEASGDLVQCMEIIKDKPDDFLLISGEDALTLPMIAAGASGTISSIANVFPETTARMVDLALRNDYVAARILAWTLLPLTRLVHQAGNPVGIKELLAALHICQKYVRPPLTTAPTSLARVIHDAATSQGNT